MLFASPTGKTAAEYLAEELRLIRELKTFGSDDPLCVNLIGSRVGELLQAYREQNPRVETPEGTTIPVFFVEIPQPPERRTAGYLPESLLEQLGDPAAKVREPADAKTRRLVHLIRACGVELIVFTHFDRLVTPQRGQILAQEFAWVLGLVLRELRTVPAVFTGDQAVIERLLTSSFDVARRFLTLELPQEQPAGAASESESE